MFEQLLLSCISSSDRSTILYWGMELSDVIFLLVYVSVMSYMRLDWRQLVVIYTKPFAIFFNLFQNI